MQPRDVLATIPELEVRDIPEGGLCCGSAGIYSLVEPDAARGWRAEARNVLATGADAVVSSNPGCLLQLQSGLAQAGHPLPARIWSSWLMRRSRKRGRDSFSLGGGPFWISLTRLSESYSPPGPRPRFNVPSGSNLILTACINGKLSPDRSPRIDLPASTASPDESQPTRRHPEGALGAGR